MSEESLQLFIYDNGDANEDRKGFARTKIFYCPVIKIAPSKPVAPKIILGIKVMCFFQRKTQIHELWGVSDLMVRDYK
jgi:hypothetical protein